MQGYWPEAWTCCEKGWDSEGCTVGKHVGLLNEKRTMLCINVGEKNPHSGKPDSGCGKRYNLSNKISECKIHSGKFLIKYI